MALQYTEAAFRLKSILGSRHLTDAEFIKGGYMVFDTVANRDLAPPYTGDDADGSKDGVILVGSFCYVQATGKFYYCSAIDAANRTVTWTEYLSSGSTNYYQVNWPWDNDNDEPGVPVITLVGDNTNIALRSLVQVTVFGDNIGSGIIFKKAGSFTDEYYVLFPDSVYLYGQWVNGIIFDSSSSTAPVNLTFSAMSQPSSLTQIAEAISQVHPHTIEWEDDTTVEISGLSITTQNL